MTKLSFTLAIALGLGALVAAGPSAADDGRARETGWFVGGAHGEADYHASVADFDDGSIVSGETDSHELGWKAFGGYRFNRWLSVELGYVELQNDFDEPTFRGRSNGAGSRFASIDDGPVSVGYSPSGVFVEAVGSVPLGANFYVFGKAGLFDWRNETVVLDLDGLTVRHENGVDPVVGAGIEYRFDFGLSLRAEYEVFTGAVDEDIDLTTAGIVYRF